MFLDHQIIILEWFSEKSCDTQAWSNDAENSAYITITLIYSNRKQLI